MTTIMYMYFRSNSLGLDDVPVGGNYWIVGLLLHSMVKLKHNGKMLFVM